MRPRLCFLGLFALALTVSAARGQTVRADGDYCQDWLVAGPFTARHLWLIQVANLLGPGQLDPQAGRPALPLMKDVPSWTRYQAVSSQVNLIDAFGPHEDAGALAFATILADRAGPATFYFGSDDEARVWINDQLVHRYDEERPLWPDQDCFTAELKAGANRCLVFVAQGTGNWGFTLRAVTGTAPSPVPLVWDVADVKGQARELFTPYWRCLAGDEPRFADPQYDDSAWTRVLPKGLVAGVKDAPVVWFRTPVWCTRALVNLPCRLSATDQGTAEIFLDGRLVCTLGADSAGGSGQLPSPGTTPTASFALTAPHQVLAVRLVRRHPEADDKPFVFELKLTVADRFRELATADWDEAVQDLAAKASQRLHRLLLIVALLLFLVFHAALLCYYPKRRANLMFCLTLTLAVATLAVLDAQEIAADRGLSEGLYWLFLAMVSVCMLTGLALAHALWRDDLPWRKLLVWAAVLVVLYAVGWTKGARTWAFVALPLCTFEFLRLYFRNAWGQVPGSWVYGLGLTCFAVAQSVNVVGHLKLIALPATGLFTYFWVYGFVALLACVSIYIGREFAGAFRQLEELTATLDRRVQQVSRQLETRLLAQARLETLRYQLNPHFLFNALNSVEALSREEPAQIPELVRRLCECLRYALHPKPGGVATLQQELDAVASFLSVEKVRFEEQLVIEVDVSQAAREQSVPEFLLQPLVENAVKYGMRTSELPLRVQVLAHCEDDRLRVEVRNTGSWSNADSGVPHGGVGLENLRNRLELLYPDCHRLATQDADGWVSISVQIPCRPSTSSATGAGHA